MVELARNQNLGVYDWLMKDVKVNVDESLGLQKILTALRRMGDFGTDLVPFCTQGTPNCSSSVGVRPSGEKVKW